MPDAFSRDLPDELKAVRTRPLFVMRLDVRPLQIVGDTAGGTRRVGVVYGGSFVGERLSGEVLDGGSDWQVLRADGVLTLDVRLVLKTTNGAMIGMVYRGFRHGPADILARIDAGETVDPARYYFRIAPSFDTSVAQYAWLNRIVAVGVGHRRPDGPVYSVFEVL
jgi:hypothetical protein